MSSVFLDPYTQQLKILTGGKVFTYSYREAINHRSVVQRLSLETIQTIRASLESGACANGAHP